MNPMCCAAKCSRGIFLTLFTTDDFFYISAAFDRRTFECVFNNVYFKHTAFTFDGALTYVKC